MAKKTKEKEVEEVAAEEAKAPEAPAADPTPQTPVISTVVATKLERMSVPDTESAAHLAKGEGWMVERIEGGRAGNTHHLVREVKIEDK